MIHSDSSPDPRLEELASCCQKVRQKSGRLVYPEEIRVLVRDLMAAGIKATEIARRSGLSTSVVWRWAKASGEADQKPVQVLSVEKLGPLPETDHVVLSLKTSEFEVSVYGRRSL